MKREHIVLRTPSINSDITKPRLLDSNGKRKSNNKIAMYFSHHTVSRISTTISCLRILCLKVLRNCRLK